MDLLVGVRDQTDRSGGFGLDSPFNFDTQQITLTVSGQIDLNASSDTGLYNDDNYTGDDTPTFSVFAPTGMTVTLTVNGGGAFAATESGTTPGLYTVTLPSGTLMVGDNTIAGTAVSPQQLQNPISLDPLVVTYAPSIQNIFVVPGAAASNQQVTVMLTSTESAFQSEVGYFIVDDLQGHLGNLAPGDAGYVQAAMNARHTLIAANQTAGATTTINVQGGQVLAFYLIQNDTSANFVANNPTNATTGAPLAFFSFAAANPDGIIHAQAIGDLSSGFVTYSWEDLLNGGDSDYNDMVVTLRTASATGSANQVLSAPAGPTRDVNATFQLQNAQKSKLNSNQGTSTTSPGEVGYFIVDSPDGAIGNLHPGDAGYAQAALNARHVLFSTGTASQTQISSAIPGGAFFGFYVVPNGTAANVLANNPTNAANGSPIALFSFSAANPDSGTVHFRTFSPEQVTQATPSANGPILVHATTVSNGASQDFDDLMFSVQFSATSGGQPNTPPAINTLGLAPSSPGTADTLTATVAAADAENDPITLTYVWKVDGTVVKTTSATSSTTDTLDLSVAGNGDKGQTVSVEVTPNDGTVDGTTSTTSVTIGNAAPVVNTITLLPAQPGTDNTLTATVAATDPDGDAMTFTYVWKVDGNVVKTTSATSATSDTLDLSQAGNGDEGQVITVEVTPNDGTVDGAVVSQNVTVNTPPAINSLTLLPNPPGTNDTLTATVAATDMDNDAITFTYVWKVNGTVVKTTSASSSTSDTLDLSVAGNGDVNETVTVEVTPNDGAIDGALTFTSVTIENTAPVVNNVSLSPNPAATNDTLTATVAATDADNDAMTFTYVWKVNGNVMKTTSATASTTDTLDLSAAGNGDDGDVVTVEVTPNDGTADGAVASTSLTVGNTAPQVDSLSLSPNPPGTNDTVTATVTASDAQNDPITFTYVWKVDGTVVKTTSATSSLTDTLDLSVAGNGDSGQVVSVEVTPNDGQVDGTLATTSATVANTAPAIDSLTLLPNQPGTDATLTATVAASDADGDNLTFTYVWKVDGNVMKTTSASSATSDTFDLSQAREWRRGSGHHGRSDAKRRHGRRDRGIDQCHGQHAAFRGYAHPAAEPAGNERHVDRDDYGLRF